MRSWPDLCTKTRNVLPGLWGDGKALWPTGAKPSLSIWWRCILSWSEQNLQHSSVAVLNKILT